ncbi:MAG TPA: lipopolysaccharide heptosyltransferase II [Candidatus Binatia bacterium]|jgi:heptosyltransferase I|nr:lipopolysaccharide heptosyltransferase II [Candidatus Binatia bacterium]
MLANLDPQNILLVLHGSIGDVTRALPLANLIDRGFPNARLTWSVEPASAPLLQHHPAVDEVILFDRARWWRQLVPFLRRIRAGRFDLVLDLQRHLKSGIISRWCGAPQRLGFHRLDCKEFNWIFNNRRLPTPGNGLSKLNHYLKFAEYLGVVPEPVEWKLCLTKAEEGAVDRHLEKIPGGFATLFVGSRWESKNWFSWQIASCAELIQQRHGLSIVLLGSKNDAAVAREVEISGRRGIFNLVGRTSLREAIGIIARANVAVGPDTGLMHIAAAVKTPVVSLWGATDPSRTGPYGGEDFVIRGRADCSPCYLRRCPVGRVCMQSIEIEEIMAKIDKALSRSRLPTPIYGTPA